MVIVWLRNPKQAGTFQDGARRLPPRETVANAVGKAVRNGMKGQSEAAVEQAVLQARREVDSLYQLVIITNVEVLENGYQREREYVLLMMCVNAEARGTAAKKPMQTLRLAVLMFLQPVIVLDAAIAQITAEHLKGDPILLHDCGAELEKQMEMGTTLCQYLNSLACEVGAEEINLEKLPNSIQSEIESKISIWLNLARCTMLADFGSNVEIHAALDRYALPFEPKSGEDKDPGGERLNFAKPERTAI
jgi:hypothetical protein